MRAWVVTNHSMFDEQAINRL